MGDTATFDPVSAPGFQVYVEAPVAVSVELFPLHIILGDDIGETVTDGLTVIPIVFVAVHPEAFLPLTV